MIPELDQRILDIFYQSGPAPAWLLQKTLGVRRQFMFDALRRLRARGLVYRYPGMDLGRDKKRRKVTLYALQRPENPGRNGVLPVRDPGAGRAFAWVTAG